MLSDNIISITLLGLSIQEIEEKLNTIKIFPIVYCVQKKFDWIQLDFHPSRIPTEEQLRNIFKNNLISYNEPNLATIVGSFLKARNETISLAESCTAGMISAWLADISGSSAYLMEGRIVYSNQAKTRLCDVPPAIIEEHGAVSSHVATLLAEGCRKRGQTDWGVSVTGIAGPSGGSIEKPIGTVFIGCANKERTQWRQFLFSGSRQEVRQQTAEQALCLLLNMMN